MTSPKPLLCPNASQVAAVKQAIADEVIVFDAFPVSAEPEIYSGGVFTAGLDLVRNTRPCTHERCSLLLHILLLLLLLLLACCSVSPHSPC
jgi:hypothetical protein